mgnify:CR=1 FL=1
MAFSLVARKPSHVAAPPLPPRDRDGEGLPVGVASSGLIFALLWQLPRGQSETFYFVWFLVGSILFYMGYTVFATPWVALGYELTPDYHERTRLMGTQNFIGQLAYVVSPWFLWIMTNEAWFDDQITGAAALAVKPRAVAAEGEVVVEAAVAEGSTMLRIGTALFGPRPGAAAGGLESASPGGYA